MILDWVERQHIEQRVKISEMWTKIHFSSLSIYDVYDSYAASERRDLSTHKLPVGITFALNRSPNWEFYSNVDAKFEILKVEVEIWKWTLDWVKIGVHLIVRVGEWRDHSFRTPTVLYNMLCKWSMIADTHSVLWQLLFTIRQNNSLKLYEFISYLKSFIEFLF